MLCVELIPVTPHRVSIPLVISCLELYLRGFVGAHRLPCGGPSCDVCIFVEFLVFSVAGVSMWNCVAGESSVWFLLLLKELYACGCTWIMVVLMNSGIIGIIVCMEHSTCGFYRTFLLLLHVPCDGIAVGDIGKSVLSISSAQLDCTQALSYRSPRAHRSRSPGLIGYVFRC